MRIGCGWVSTRDQHPEAQADALAAAGCDEVFVDKTSGAQARRPEPDVAQTAAEFSVTHHPLPPPDHQHRLLSR